jgi:hypothetical protein
MTRVVGVVVAQDEQGQEHRPSTLPARPAACQLAGDKIVVYCRVILPAGGIH